MKALLIAVLILSPCLSPSSHAGYVLGFGNLSLNYLNWDRQTEEKSPKRDFAYLELEGGAQFTWGELYGFFDLENVGKDSSEMRTSLKGIGRYYLGKSNFSIYGHIYDFGATGFSEQTRVLGLGYQHRFKSGWFSPFLGVHDVTQTYFTGLNGGMAGWVFGYSFKIAKEDFLLINWHEFEFERAAGYIVGNGGKKIGQNGAASLWWNMMPKVTLGAQWRYAKDKLGTEGVMNAFIASLRLNF